MLWWFLLGMSTGMRTMTPIAVLCWFAWFGMPEPGWASWTASLASVILFTLFALGEYVGDTLPQTPNRTSAFPMVSRLVFGALAGALGAHPVAEPVAGGAILGLAGALTGTYGGYHVRTFLARKVGKDLPVAICESAVALGIAIAVVSVIQGDAVADAAAAARTFF